jgi:hypothetical protein
MERQFTIQSTRESLAELGVHPIVSMAPTLLDALCEDDDELLHLPPHSASKAAQGTETQYEETTDRFLESQHAEPPDVHHERQLRSSAFSATGDATAMDTTSSWPTAGPAHEDQRTMQFIDKVCKISRACNPMRCLNRDGLRGSASLMPGDVHTATQKWKF